MTFRSAATAQALGYDSGARLATASDITVGLPAGTADGDILVAVIDISTASSASSLGLVAAPPAGWTTVVNSTSFFQHVFWKVAASEPSSYTFSFHESTVSGTAKTAFANATVGCWTDWTSPTLKTFSLSANRAKTVGASNSVFFPGTPHVVDIDSVTLDGSETTTGGIQIATWSAVSSIENFAGSVVWSNPPNPAYPATVPYNTTTVESPQVEHAQLYFAGLPTYNGGEDVTTTLAANRISTLASHDVTAGTLPDVTADFTWQHAGDEAGYGEIVQVIRLVIEATPAPQAYWGILATAQ